MRRQKPVKYTQKKNLHNMRKYNIDIVILIMGNRHNLYTHGKIINKNDQIYTNTRIYRNINRILITYNEKKQTMQMTHLHLNNTCGNRNLRRKYR